MRSIPFYLITLAVCVLSSLTATAGIRHRVTTYRPTISLAGTWRVALDTDGHLGTLPTADTPITLPGTTDEGGLGQAPTDTTETTRLTRAHSFKGRAWFSRTVTIPRQWAGRQIRMLLERTKVTTVYVDGRLCGGSNDIVAPQTFDLTRALTPGDHVLTVCVDNGSSLPQQLYSSSHQLCEDTQTNWNGILGRMELQALNPCHITRLEVRPRGDGTAMVLVHFAGRPDRKARLNITVTRDGAEQPRQESFTRLDQPQADGVNMSLPIRVADNLRQGGTLGFNLDMSRHFQAWSEWTPTVYRLTAEITGADRQEATFGFVTFTARDHHFYVNDRLTYLRGKHDACVWPLTAHAPMDRDSWRRYFSICHDYGINHVRFHSWCPPEAAFAMADSLGIYLQPELPFWGNFDKKDTLLMNYLLQEGRNLIRAYGHHPSFRMMALGNELWGDIDAMQQFVRVFRAQAPDKLYTLGSNYYLGYQGIRPEMDYFTTCRIGGEAWGQTGTHTRGSFAFADARNGGTLNTYRPSTVRTFEEACAPATVPIISHETGQFQTYPDYDEIGKYTGVLRPYNLQVFRRRLVRAGMGQQAKAFHRASGLWSKELYKADIEMDLRTRDMAGFQLLDLQDYPGQGSAYVGMLDAFMDSKGLTTPREWRQWCSPVVPLAEMDSVCFASSDTLRARIQVANYSGQPLSNLALVCTLSDGTKAVDIRTCGTGTCRVGLTDQGSVSFPLSAFTTARQLGLTLTFVDDTGQEQPGLGQNIYKVWVYPSSPLADLKRGITIVHTLREAAAPLAQGRSVLLTVCADSLAGTADSLQHVGPLFQTDYWNWRMFKTISQNNHKPVSPGTLGLCIADPAHPLFSAFPTEGHTSWQWFSVVQASAPLVLDNLARAGLRDYRPLVQVIDNIERNHRLGLVMEFRVGQGRLLICAADLDRAARHVEGRAFYASLLGYMQSSAFSPRTAISFDALSIALTRPADEQQLRELNNISQY